MSFVSRRVSWWTRELLLNDVDIGRRPLPAVVVTKDVRGSCSCYRVLPAVDVSPIAFLPLRTDRRSSSWCSSSSRLPCVEVARLFIVLLSVFL